MYDVFLGCCVARLLITRNYYGLINLEYKAEAPVSENRRQTCLSTFLGSDGHFQTFVVIGPQGLKLGLVENTGHQHRLTRSLVTDEGVS